MASKPVKKKSKDWRDRKNTDMRVFYRTVDWAAWWEDFYTSIKADGMLQYRTVREFIRSRKATPVQQTFLTWYLGPREEDETKWDADYKTHQEKWPWTAPVGWYEVRQTGGWHSPQMVKKIAGELGRRESALEAMREVGNRVTLCSVYRAEQLAREIDRCFQGQMFVPGRPFEENTARAKIYLDLQDKALRLIDKAQDMFARAHGVNTRDTEGLIALMQTSSFSGVRQLNATSNSDRAVEAITRMTIAKAARFKMDLPTDAEQAIVDIVASTSDEKKKKVQ